jgi:Family of unknown function (DUF5995)
MMMQNYAALKRINPKPSNRLTATIQPRSWGDLSQPEQSQLPSPRPARHDFANVDLFAHDPGPRSVPNMLQAKPMMDHSNYLDQQATDQLDKSEAKRLDTGTQELVQLTPLKITTPDRLPDPPMAGAIPPPLNEVKKDAEGNEISQAMNGKWYLSQAPSSLSFPIADGFKPHLLPINPNASFQALLSRCQEIEAEQFNTSEQLKGDMKYWFARVYYYVTKFELQKLQKGDYLYPHMKMQEVIQFYNTYKTNLDNWQANNKDLVEANWQQAFASAESMNDGSWLRTTSLEIMKALLPSMEAHIRFDLPRAIAAVYDLHYAGIPGAGMSNFKADFFRMGEVFEQANDALTKEIDEDESWLRSFDPTSWNWSQEAGFPFIFHVGLERNMAWEKAESIHQNRNLDPQQADRRLRSGMRVAHPNLEPFEVDGENVADYDWFNQPGGEADAPGPAPEFLPAPPAPSVPEKLFFKLDRPNAEDKLENAVRGDQDLAPLLELAEWTRQVRGVELIFEGHASEEGEEYENYNLAHSRAFLIEHFLFHQNADLVNNQVNLVSKGEESAKRGPEWRYVVITVAGNARSKQQYTPENKNLPSEVTGRSKGE